MDRRTFFKGMFSAAVVASIPKPIFDTIIAAPSEPEFKKLCSGPENNGMFIFDRDKLVGWTSTFSVNLKRELVDVSFRRDNSPYPTYMPGPIEWKILASNLPMELPREYFMENRVLTAIMKYNDIEFNGEVVMTEVSIHAQSEDRITYSASFIGCGALIRTT